MSGASDSTVEVDERNLAMTMHETLCQPNQPVDWCAWSFEIHADVHNWNAPAHKHWLLKAHNVTQTLPGVSIEDIMTVVRALA